MKAVLIPLSCVLTLAAVTSAEERVAEAVVGEAAPDFTVTGIDGATFKLSQITGRGKNVALMFSRAHW